MRKYITAAALTLLGFGADAAAQGTPVPIAYVRSRRLLEETPGSKEASATLQREQNKYRADLALAEDSLTKMLTDYQQKLSMMSAAAKKAQEDAIRARRQSLESRAGQADQLMQKRQQELLKPIMDRINKALEDFRKENRYALILDADNGAIVAADSTLDVTTRILAKLKPGTAGAPRD